VIDDVLTEVSVEREAMPLGVSPDGQLLAYVLTSSLSNSTVLRVLNLKTRAQTNISEGLRSASFPIWSPDGRFLAFLITDTEQAGVLHHKEIWIWDRSHAARRRLTDAVATPFPGHLIWTADSRFLISDAITVPSHSTVKTAVDLTEPKARESDGVTVRRQWVNLPSALTDKTEEATSPITWRSDVFRVDVNSGRLQQIAEGVRPRAYAAAPSGSAIAMLTQDLETSADDLWMTDPVSGRLQVWMSRIATGEAALSWSPSGKMLALHSTNQPWGEEPRGDAGVCDLIELSTRTETKFAVDAIALSHRAIMNVPLWTDQSDAVGLLEAGKFVIHPVASPGAVTTLAVPGGGTVESLVRGQQSRRLSEVTSGGRLVAIVNDLNGVSMHVATIDLATKAVALWGGDGLFYSADGAAIVGDGAAVVLGVESPSRPFDLFSLNVNTGHQEQLTHLNPQYDRYAFGDARFIAYRNATGDPRTAILLLPARYHAGMRYPTIVFERDTTKGDIARHFGLWGGPYNLQLYATRGYAVLYPDIVVTRTPRERVTSDVLPAIDAAVRSGIVDPERLALYGHSLGAYHAMMLLVQTNRFKTAIVSQGYYNLFTFYAEEGYSEGYVTATPGPPWQYPDRYAANSPYLFIDKLSTPILLVGSSRDAYPAQGNDLFAALRQANRPVEYIYYDGEAHYAGSWSLDNRRDYVVRTIEWLEYWLRPRT
jgi:dipeptidyl aminopeptidase/acylaminoacyl peptidase